MTENQASKTKRINELAHQFCAKPVKRRDLEKLAKNCGWNIRRGGSEPLIAHKEGYRSIPIPGHGKHAVIKWGLLLEISGRLFEPLVDLEMTRVLIQTLLSEKEALENTLQVQHQVYKESELWNNLLESENYRLKDEIEISIQLASNTEFINGRIKSRYARLLDNFISIQKKFKNQLIKIKTLEEEKENIIQDFEEMNIQVKKIETGGENTLKKLKQFSKTLDPRNREKLSRIIHYLQEQIS